MIKILFMRSNKANLPEIGAYIKFFNLTSEFRAYDSSELEKNFDIDEFDIIWEFKGYGGIQRTDKITVHEYASLSTGMFPKTKNKVKKIINRKPDLRIFLNESVYSEFDFNDDIPFLFRDMGIDEEYFSVSNAVKEYKYVYIGDVSKDRDMDRFLEHFCESEGGGICLIGKVDKDILEKYKNNNRIYFYGKIPYEKVPEIASRAEYGINYIPNKYPFNLQTSTKLLEYLALDLKIITTDYLWVNEFEKENDCSFYKLPNDIEFNQNEIEEHIYINKIDLKELYWNKVIRDSGVHSKLIELYQQKYNC